MRIGIDLGGTKIETGLDANNNNTLDPSEVNAAATSYVCTIAPSNDHPFLFGD